MIRAHSNKIPAILCLVALVFGTSTLAQAKTVTDQLGRKVDLPDRISRAVVLEHHALDVIIQLGAKEQIVGTMEKWKEFIPDAVKAMPNLETIATPGDL